MIHYLHSVITAIEMIGRRAEGPSHYLGVWSSREIGYTSTTIEWLERSKALSKEVGRKVS